MPASFLNVLIYAGIVLLALVVIGIVLTRLYRRATKDVALIRTGFGGEKVVMNGGALIIPILHETIPVNMNTLRLAVERKNEQALITKDRMRVDVLAEFYVRVQPSSEAIAFAAQRSGSHGWRLRQCPTRVPSRSNSSIALKVAARISNRL